MNIKQKAIITSLIVWIFPLYFDLNLYNLLNIQGFWQHSMFINIILVLYVPMYQIMRLILKSLIETFDDMEWRSMLQ